MIILGENIKRLRKASGLTQPQLAERLEVTPKVISDYETSKANPPVERLSLIAKLFGVTVDELIGTKEIKSDNLTKNNRKSRHGNSRSVKLLELFDHLLPEEQRITLKQIRGLIAERKRK